MGWCHEFGPQIVEGCEHPMTAGPSSCSCERCGTVCTGRFRGCGEVWDRGPRQVAAPRPGVDIVLTHLFERVEALEQALAAAPRAETPELGSLEDLVGRTAAELDQHRARTIERLDELAVSVTTLGHLAERVQALEWVGNGVTVMQEALTELGRGLDRITAQSNRLSAESDRLSAAPERIAALERALDQRLGGMENAVADLGEALEELSARVTRLGGLPRRVKALENAEEPVSLEVVDAVQARLQELSGRTEHVRAVPERLDVLEQAAFGGGPVSRSRSIVADLDAVGAQVDAVATVVDGVPERLATVEQASARTEALERGLAGAIEVIDEMAAQLAALEWAYRPLPPPEEDE